MIWFPPAGADGRLFFATDRGRAVAIETRRGQVLWQAAVAGNRVFVGSYDHRLCALEASTGRVLWSFNGLGPVTGTATVIEDLVFFSTCGSCSEYESNPAAKRTLR